MNYDALIQDLICCPKFTIKADRKKPIIENRSLRHNIDLHSENGKYLFRMFLRQSDAFFEDFSVGLIWTNPKEYIGISRNVIVLRFQGPHDSKQPEGNDIHHSYHIHQITSADINSRRLTKPAHKSVTSAYSSFESAIKYFINICHISDTYGFLDYYVKPYFEDSLVMDGQLSIDETV